jgi:hypothetical protein
MMAASPRRGDDVAHESESTSDLGERFAATVAADAAALGTDLHDPEASVHFQHGIEVALAWLQAAHETGSLPDGAFTVVEQTLSVALSSVERVTSS